MHVLYALAACEPTIFSSGGGRDDRFPIGQKHLEHFFPVLSSGSD
jgi:hypothetical protein